MSVQRKINKTSLARERIERKVSPLKADKGEANGHCNRTACQAPLADEPEHQFMEGNFTGGPRLHYCRWCAAMFDRDDKAFGDPMRIKREWKVQVA